MAFSHDLGVLPTHRVIAEDDIAGARFAEGDRFREHIELLPSQFSVKDQESEALVAKHGVVAQQRCRVPTSTFVRHITMRTVETANREPQRGRSSLR